MDEIFEIVLGSSKFIEAVNQKSLSEIYGGLKSIFISYVAKNYLNVCVITNEKEEIGNDLTQICDKNIIVMPELDKPISLEQKNNLFFAIEKIMYENNWIVVSEFENNLPKKEKINSIKIECGKEILLNEFIEKLLSYGYEPVSLVTDLCQFSTRGGIIDLWALGHDNPVRIEFYVDEVYSIREFEPVSQTSINKLNSIRIFSTNIEDENNTGLQEYLSENTLLILDGIKLKSNFNTIYLGSEGYSLGSKPTNYGNLQLFNQNVNKLKDYNIFLIANSEIEKERIKEILPNFSVRVANLSSGFILPDVKLAVFTYNDIFGKKLKRATFKGSGVPLSDITSLQPGDYVVHIDYGIGIYEGIKKIKIDHSEKDCIVILYKNDTKIYVPIDKAHCIERWIGVYDKPPKLSDIGGVSWQIRKARTKKSIELYVNELLSLYAERKVSKGIKFLPDCEIQNEIEASFPYKETEAQISVIKKIKDSMESPFPTDILVCGDVGFGKTEIALRASIKAVMSGKQVAILCPTTLLVEQHYRTFRERLVNFPIDVESLSRFRKKEENKIIKELENGKIDIIIGTHRLLQDDVKFYDLGLLIIDDEHKFGVMQKEKIRKLKKNIDTISLSATPIPRTLYMALSGIKDIAYLDTPPKGRLPIITQVSYWDENLIYSAINFELSRFGQVYFVHNRINTIQGVANIIRNMSKKFKVGVAHSKLSESELDEVMIKFLFGEINVLVCTAIIGAGIDIPQANTIIINMAEKFGLSELHQLRGRVGRGNVRGYCYLIITKNITKEAKKRLQTIATHTELGAGFAIAMRDMELRGVGNLLGKEQHGHIHSIGYELYTKMLEEEIKKIKGEKIERIEDINVKFLENMYLPDDYVSDSGQKFLLYKELANCKTLEEVSYFREKIIDRYGNPPKEFENLLLLQEIKILANKCGIKSIIQKKNGVEIEFARKIKKLTILPGEILYSNYKKNSVIVCLNMKNLAEIRSFLLRNVKFNKCD